MPDSGTNQKKVSKESVITINLAEIEGDGDFQCPKCGANISPEDETENVYKIIDEKVDREILVELKIQCNSCLTQINLIGFPNFDLTKS